MHDSNRKPDKSKPQEPVRRPDGVIAALSLAVNLARLIVELILHCRT